jgi:hypothetical protein
MKQFAVKPAVRPKVRRTRPTSHPAAFHLKFKTFRRNPMLSRISRVALGAVAVALVLCTSVEAAAALKSGKIKSVDAEKNTMVVTVEEKDHTFTIGETADISLDGKKAKAADLKAGHKVTVTFTESEDKMVASKIVATSKKDE